jgi:hypothetical protein
MWRKFSENLKYRDLIKDRTIVSVDPRRASRHLETCHSPINRAFTMQPAVHHARR